jgi:hypothetical protein
VSAPACESTNLRVSASTGTWNVGAGSGIEHGNGCIAFETTKLVADGWFEHVKRTLVF